MKRILTAGVLALWVTVFFTACTSIVMQEEIDPDQFLLQIQNSVAAESFKADASTEEAPDYYEINSRIKFSEQDGEEAFCFKDGHSSKTQDLEDFQIAALLNNRTFVYGYVTCSEDDSNEIVHCGAFYQYKDKTFKVFHEKTFQRTNKEESFYLQVCQSMDGTYGDIFVYDNGEGYLYDKNGSLKFHADVETFVQNQYKNVFSVSIAHAFTDENNRIYLELFIEKEELNIPQGSGNEDTHKQEDEEALDREMEALEKEVQDKTESLILVYEFNQIHSTINQDNTAFSQQMSEWKYAAQGKEFPRDEEPDADKDWESAVKKYPDKWGTAYLKDLNSLPVYEWKTKPTFQKDEGVCNFIPINKTFQGFTDVQENRKLQEQFIPLNDNFSHIYGEIGKLEYYNPITFYRTFTLYWDENETNAEGKSVSVRKTKEVTQTLEKPSCRKAPLQECFTESYFILDREKTIMLESAAGNELIGKNKDNHLYWIQPNKKYQDAKINLEEEDEVSILRDGKYIYLVVYNMTTRKIKIIPDSIHQDNKPDSNETVELNYSDLPGVAQKGNSAEDKQFENMNEADIIGNSSGYDGGFLRAENLLISSLSLKKNILKALKFKGSDSVWQGLEDSKNGILMTIPNLGIIYYDTKEKKSLTLIDGTWYQSWKIDDQYISIGFSNADSIYESKDVAFAKIYEYSLNDIANKRLENLLEQMMNKEKESIESSAAQSSEDMTSTAPREGVEDPMELWNREYQNKYDSLEE